MQIQLIQWLQWQCSLEFDTETMRNFVKRVLGKFLALSRRIVPHIEIPEAMVLRWEETP